MSPFSTTTSVPKSELSFTRPSIEQPTIPKPDEARTRWSTSRAIERAVKTVLLDEARRRFEEEDAWWREHRDAKELLTQEFEHAIRHLISLPQAGKRYRVARGKLIQRWLMKKTGCHVYYFHDSEHDVLEIHSLWGARRLRGPRL